MKKTDYTAVSECFKEILDNSPVGTLKLDEKLRIVYENPKMKEILGVPPDEESKAIGTDIRKLPSVKRTGLVDKFNELLKGKGLSVETRFTSLYGKESFLRVVGVPLFRDKKFAGAVLFVMDISQYKKVEEKLRESEKRFSDIAENSGEWIWEVDAEGRYTYSNTVVERVLGYKAEEIIGKFFYDFFHPDEREQLKSVAFEVFKRKEPFAGFVNRNIHKDGHVVILETSGVPIIDAEGKLIGYRGADRDITEQKKAEEALRESEEKYRSLFENASDAILILDRKGNILSANKVFAEYGYEKDELIGKNMLHFVPKKHWPKLGKHTLDVLRGKTVEGEVEVITKKGKRIAEYRASPIRKERKIVGAEVILRDVTERKKMEEALRESEELFRTIVENSHDTILIMDENFRIIYANEEATRLSGYQKKEIIGQDFRKFLHKDSRALVEDRYLRRQRGEIQPSQYKFKIVRKNGEERDVEIKAALIQNRHGRKRTIAQLLDITENKKMENQRKLYDKRLSALNMYGQSLNMAKSMEEIYKLTVEAMEKILGFEFSDIFIIEGDMLCLKLHKGFSNVPTLTLPLNGRKGVTAKAARTGKPILIPDVRKEKNYVEGAEGIRSELAVPMKLGDKVIGVLNVESRKLNAFDENDKKLLEILASHAAIAITNLKKQQTLSALNEYAKNLNKAQKQTEIHEITLDVMEKILGFEYASFFRVKGKMLRLVAQRKYPEKLTLNLPLEGKKGITVKAAKTGKPVIVPDVRKDPYYVVGAKGMLSELAVPIKAGKRILGVLNVESKRIAAFDEDDKELLEALASHAATAITNLERREELREISKKIANLMRSSTKIMQVKDMQKRLKVIAKAIQKFGWRRVVISLRDENLEGTDIVTVGLTKEEQKLLMERKAPGHVWRERLGPKFERFKIGEFYYLPWSDPWIREHIHGLPPETPPDVTTTYAGVLSRLSPEEMVDWHPQDMLYAPLRTPEGKIVGILSMDDPVDGRKPTKETLAPLELFLHQAAITIENAQLIESLRQAREKLEEYAEKLEQKVEERTRELRESQEKLLKAQRLAVIGELAGMVGHDLRNPLTSIAGAQYYLKKKLTPKVDVKIKEMLELIEKNIEYSNKIINDLLDYSREIELEPTETDPRTLVEETLSLVEIPKNIKVKKRVQDKPKIWVDIGKMKRVFVNIVKNAVEAMPKGGTITVTSRKRNNNIEFSFSDTGVGMKKEVLEKIWTPLFTTKAKGMGFGLAICKRIVEAHGGNIIVESEIGKGTTFTVVVPIKPEIKEGGEKIWVKALESSLLTTTKT